MHSDLNTSSTDSSPSELPKTFRLNKREEITEDYGDPELLFLSEEEFDDAIIGVAHRIGQEDVIAYDYNKLFEIVKKMMNTEDDLEVMEHIEFNIMGSYVGERTPTFVDVV